MQFSRILTYPKHGTAAFLYVRLALYLAIGIGLYYSFENQAGYLVSVQWPTLNLTLLNLTLLLTVILMAPLNWSLEALKWQIICSTSKLSFIEALKSVLTGLTLGSIIPFGFGGVTGRIMTLNNRNRLMDVPGAIVGQWLQTFITLAFGAIGIYMVIENGGLINIPINLLIVLPILAVIAFFVFLKHSRRFLSKALHAIGNFSGRDWLNISVLALLRYLVFLAQLLLLIKVFAPQLEPALMLGCATWVFVARTVVPRISSIETLGIRAASAWYFLWLAGVPFEGTLVAIFSLWIINLFVPSLAGMLWLGRLHWQQDLTK